MAIHNKLHPKGEVVHLYSPRQNGSCGFWQVNQKVEMKLEIQMINKNNQRENANKCLQQKYFEYNRIYGGT